MKHRKIPDYLSVDFPTNPMIYSPRDQQYQLNAKEIEDNIDKIPMKLRFKHFAKKKNIDISIEQLKQQRLLLLSNKLKELTVKSNRYENLQYDYLNEKSINTMKLLQKIDISSYNSTVLSNEIMKKTKRKSNNQKTNEFNKISINNSSTNESIVDFTQSTTNITPKPPDELMRSDSFTNNHRKVHLIIHVPTDSPIITPMITNKSTTNKDIRKKCIQHLITYISLIRYNKNMFSYYNKMILKRFKVFDENIDIIIKLQRKFRYKYKYKLKLKQLNSRLILLFNIRRYVNRCINISRSKRVEVIVSYIRRNKTIILMNKAINKLIRYIKTIQKNMRNYVICKKYRLVSIYLLYQKFYYINFNKRDKIDRFIKSYFDIKTVKVINRLLDDKAFSETDNKVDIYIDKLFNNCLINMRKQHIIQYNKHKRFIYHNEISFIDLTNNHKIIKQFLLTNDNNLPQVDSNYNNNSWNFFYLYTNTLLSNEFDSIKDNVYNHMKSSQQVDNKTIAINTKLKLGSYKQETTIKDLRNCLIELNHHFKLNLLKKKMKFKMIIDENNIGR